ncbi:MAG: TolC family protein, partial [Roseimicrobium sp.]
MDLIVVEKLAPAKWAALPKPSQTAATGWLNDYESPALTALVQHAIAQNFNLQATAAKVAQARALAKAAGADLWPQLAVSLDGQRSQSASGQRFVGVGQRNNRFQLGA